MATDETQTLRLDIWLWRARFFKTRSACTKFIDGKGLRLTRNGQTSRIKKAHYRVCPGDHLTFIRANQLVDIIIDDIGLRRGPAPEAQALYHAFVKIGDDDVLSAASPAALANLRRNESLPV